MTDLLAARIQMAGSLGFHIIFAVVGMVMPLFMVLAEWQWRRRGEARYLRLARAWARGTAIMFAVGAVSGTVLSFQLGLLWPKFMAFAGPIIGFPFALEGFAFFLEAIFLGIYLYGWEKVSPRLHLFSGFMVWICGTLSGIFVVTVNAWMNTPAGFVLENGIPTAIDPIAAMLNPAAFTQCTHMTLAAIQALSFAVAGIHAWALLKRPRSELHKAALGIVLPIAIFSALLQPLVGDLSAKTVAKTQWVKLAAMEGQWETEKAAPLRIGGWPDESSETTPFAIGIPYLLSILAYGDPNAEVRGLKEAPAEDRPPVAPVHLAFQVMVACGMTMALTALMALIAWWRNNRKLPSRRWFLKLLVWNTPLGFIAIEAGWMVTEIGRQPWVIHGVMRTEDAVTEVGGLWLEIPLFSILYLCLIVIAFRLLRRQVFQTLEDEARHVT